MKVQTFPELTFAGLRSVKPRTEPVRAVVLHWTGGPDRGPGASKDAAGVFRTLRNTTGPRTPDGLSIHAVLDAEGILVPMAPESLVCLHAGVANPWSIGKEIINPAFPGRVADAEKAKGTHREEYRDTLRGKVHTFLDFTPAQYATLGEWLDEVLARWKLPRAIPREKSGEWMRRQMTRAELATFRGVMGHFHCHHSKLDPGPRLFDWLADRGFK